MADPMTFMPSYFANISKMVDVVNVLRQQHDQLVQDPALIDEYFAYVPPTTRGGYPPPRSDIVKADVTACENALVQVFFTFDSGSPPQKAAFYQVLP